MNPHKYLIIRFSSIGDIIQCMPVTDGIRNKDPHARIDWVTRNDMAVFLQIDPNIDRIVAFDRKSGFRGLIRLGFALRKEKYDYIYDAHSNLRSFVLSLILAGPFARFRRSYVKRGKHRWKRFLLFRFGIDLYPLPFKGSESFRKPLRKWQIEDFSVRPDKAWKFPEPAETPYADWLRQKFVTLVPSANWPMKRWPVSHWQELVRRMPDTRFLILAGPQDRFCETIAQTAPERVLNLSGKTSLAESIRLIFESAVVVSGDTGLLHAADLFGKKGIALIGPTAFGYPSGSNIKIREIDLKCRPCTKDGHGKCRQAVYQRCLAEIRATDIAEDIYRELGRDI